jgi:hypothetical protein
MTTPENRSAPQFSSELKVLEASRFPGDPE